MDVVVTIAKQQWIRWLAEGDLPGEDPTGEWGLYFGGDSMVKPRPPRHLSPGDRVYVLAHGFIRGYAPLIRIADTPQGYALVRAGGAVACTVQYANGVLMPQNGFQGIRYRWWDRREETTFPDWMERGLTNQDRATVERIKRLRASDRYRRDMQQRAIDGKPTREILAGMPE